MGNLPAREAPGKAAVREITTEEYEQVRDRGLDIGTIKKGRGRGGAIAPAPRGVAKGRKKRPPSFSQPTW